MSLIDSKSVIILTNSAADIKRKILRHTFRGDHPTVELQKEKKADLDIDGPFQYLQFFLEMTNSLKIFARSTAVVK